LEKLMATLACSAVLSMSLAGAGYAESAAGTVGVYTNDGVTGNVTRGYNTTYPTGTYTNDGTMTNRAGTVAPLNTTRTGTYRATSTTATTTRGSNWGWLGLLGLFGLVGMRSRTGDRTTSGDRR